MKVRLMGGPCDGEWIELSPEANIANLVRRGACYSYRWGGDFGTGLTCYFTGWAPRPRPLVIDSRLFNMVPEESWTS